MRLIQVPIYKFNELSKESQEKVIEKHYAFLVNTAYTTDTKEDIEAREQTTREDVIESININEYEFYADGALIPVEFYN
jgi:hypothetical protein